MRTTIEQRAREASGRERHCGKCKFGEKACAYVEICHEAFVRGYVKGVFSKKGSSTIASLSIKPQQFDKAVWQTETGFTSAKYNTWLKNAVDSLQNIYQQLEESEEVEIADLYILGDIINMLNITKIVKQK